MATQEQLQQERDRAILALQAAVYTCLVVQPPLTLEEIEDIIDAEMVEVAAQAARSRAREALIRNAQQRLNQAA